MANGLISQANGVEDNDTGNESYNPSEEETPTPEDQEAYTTTMKMVSELIYNDDKSHAAIIEQLSKGTPPTAIAEITSFILAQLEDAFQGQMPEAIIIHVADETSDLLLELAEESDSFELTDDVIIRSKGAVMKVLIEDYGLEEEDLEALLEGVTSDDLESLHGSFGGQ